MMDETLSGKNDRAFVAAIPALAEAADRLEDAGFSQAAIADALLVCAFTIGPKTAGLETTARVLAGLAARLSTESKPKRLNAH